MDRRKGEHELVLPNIGRLLLQNILNLRERYLKEIFDGKSVTQVCLKASASRSAMINISNLINSKGYEDNGEGDIDVDDVKV